MNNRICVFMYFVMAASVVFAGTRQQATTQQDSTGADRVEKLERRVELLERVVFSSARLSKMQAQRQVAEAKERLNHTKSLFAKGYVNASELQQDQFRLEQAQQELELAKTESKQNELVGEMDVLRAEQRVSELEQRFTYTKRLAEKGYVPQLTVENIETALDLAKRNLENAKIKLEAARKLETIK